MNTSPRLAFIGGGNMARSIIGGLINSGWSAAGIVAADPQLQQRVNLHDLFSIETFEDNGACLEGADVVVLAVKPQMMQQALQSVSAPLQRQGPLLVSIAAGIRSDDLLRWAGLELPCVRVMPNTPSLVNAGVSGLFANALASREQRDMAEKIMRAVGETIWVDSESLIDTVTGVSGSGPAYFFKLMELMIDAGVDHGLDRDDATTLVLQTALGAAKLAGQSDCPPAQLRQQVTSPNGTTQAGLEEMTRLGLDDAVSSGVNAAIRRSVELAEFLGD